MTAYTYRPNRYDVSYIFRLNYFSRFFCCPDYFLPFAPLSFVLKGEHVNNQSFEEHIQHVFDSFCKKVIRNAARDYYRVIKRRNEKEIMFSELSVQEMEQFFVIDQYPDEENIFTISGCDIVIENESLAEALTALPEKKRDIILLYHFLGLTDKEIGKLMYIPLKTVHYHRTGTIHLLRKIMEEKIND